MLRDSLKKQVEALVSVARNRKVIVTSAQAATGGCINECYVIRTETGPLFLKVNNVARYPGLFESERKGLDLLRAAVPRISPEVVALDSGIEYVLIMEYIEPGKISSGFWQQVAESLVTLHRTTQENFGLDHDNYMGSLPQSNRKHTDWIAFFIMERLEPQLRRAIDNKVMGLEWMRPFQRLFSALNSLFPIEAPSLLHGDLWSGNYLVDGSGTLKLVDPAVYFGFREMDLAMMKLFGGFDRTVFDIYQERFPLESGYRQREDLCNLYPLLVHANLFGGHYAVQVGNIVRRF